jgi:PTH1 family peptidyl-tRNA hydrolase
LAKPSKADRQAIDDIVDEAVASLPLLLAGDAVKAMTRLHSVDSSQPPNF